MKIIVLGGDGFLGSALFSRAQREGHETVGITRDTYEAQKGLSCDVFVNANGSSKKYVADHDPSLDFDLATRSVMRSLHDFKFGLYIYVSTVVVYNRPEDPAQTSESSAIDPARLTPYGFHRFLAEWIVRRYASRWLILRVGGLVGPGLSKGPVFDIVSGLESTLDPSSRFQFVDTRFVASVLLECLKRGTVNEVINVCGDGAVFLSDVFTWAGHKPDAGLFGRHEVWDINNNKLKAILPVPLTSDTVRDYIRESGTP